MSLRPSPRLPLPPAAAPARAHPSLQLAESPEPASPTRAALAAAPPHYLVQGRRHHADLRLLRLQDRLWVIKDFSARPWWLRWTLGFWLTRRELSALRRLQGLDGIPRNVTRVDALAFAYHYVDGNPLRLTSYRQLSPDFFCRYEQLLEAMHARGIAHLQLGGGSNVLVTPELQPVLLDFQTHLRLPRWFSRLTALLVRMDFRALATVWNRYMLAVLHAEQPTIMRRR
jgi:hypothetical protein